MKIGILGGGQLAKMLAEAAKELGIRTVCIDPDTACPAKSVTEVHHCDLSNTSEIDAIFTNVDFITYETENLSINYIEQLANKHKLKPGIEALKISQDRLYEKNFLNNLNIPTTQFLPISSWDSLHNAINTLGSPCILKTRCSGYDGKGQSVIRSMHDAEIAWNEMESTELILEKMIDFDAEVSMIAVRNKIGDILFYPLTRNEHESGILRFSHAPHADVNLENSARQYVSDILKAFDYVGVIAVEFFCVNGALIANEIAPRVHNSGHWTIEGADTSQFENHLRAITNLPLRSTNTNQYCTMINCIGNEPDDINGIKKMEGVYYHSYGKVARKNRKLGHITACANSKADLESIIKNLC